MNNLMLPQRSCISCKYFVPPRGQGLGECHRFPPHLQTLAVPKDGGGMELHNVTGFSQVAEDMWCGEHKPKIGV